MTLENLHRLLREKAKPSRKETSGPAKLGSGNSERSFLNSSSQSFFYFTLLFHDVGRVCPNLTATWKAACWRWTNSGALGTSGKRRGKRCSSSWAVI